MKQLHTHVDLADDACYRKSSMGSRGRSTLVQDRKHGKPVMEPTEPHWRGLVLGSGAADAAVKSEENQACCIMLLEDNVRQGSVDAEDVKQSDLGARLT
jgi:hypothetical protein